MSKFHTYNKLVGDVTSFDEMLGRAIIKYVVTDDTLTFYFTDTNFVEFYHVSDCCESVYIESVDGDLDDLLFSPLTVAEEVAVNLDLPANAAYVRKDEESYTWTFYKFATEKGSVTVRWLGTSNGYYSESVSVKFVTSDAE